MEFTLDSRLQQDCFLIGKNDSAQLLLMNDSRYPWFILVPTKPGVSEWFDLQPDEQIRLHQDSVALAQCIQKAFGCEKMNVAALGNIVRQMHVHVVGRKTNDAAWPGPVWGHSPAIPYTETGRQSCKEFLFRQAGLPFEPI